MKKFIKKHKVFSTIVFVILGVFLFSVVSLLWTIQKKSVDIVAKEDVDPTAEKVQIAEKEQEDVGVFNVLLVGSDSRDPNGDMGRSDSMMLVSFNKAENKSTIVSFLRDSLVDIEGYGKSRLGHTYAYGGVGLTINTINDTYDLDVQNYVTISFDNLVGIIDEIGGVDVYISAEEAEYYRACGMRNIVEGMNTLSGSQALSHTRNRTLGTDFERTRRQRSVMYGIYNKIMSSKDVTNLLPLIEYCMTQVETNLTVPEIYEWAKLVLETDNLLMQQQSMPHSDTYTSIVYEGMEVLEIDFEKNKAILKELLY